MHFFVNIANSGSHISESLQWIFLKLHRLTKFGTINRFMGMNFCFNVKHKKSQFCVISWKWYISLHLSQEGLLPLQKEQLSSTRPHLYKCLTEGSNFISWPMKLRNHCYLIKRLPQLKSIHHIHLLSASFAFCKVG